MIKYIEGIRGVASMQVLLSHLCCVFLPMLIITNYSEDMPIIGKIWINSPLNLFNGGNQGVRMFFIISGYFIADKVYSGVSIKDLLLNIQKKYVRFLKIVIPGIMLMFCLMIGSMMYQNKVLEVSPQLTYGSLHNCFDANIFDAIYDAFIRTFFSTSKYNGPFWTLKYEFIGTIILPFILYFLNKINNISKYRKYVIIIMAICFVFISDNYSTMIFGVLSYDIHYTRIHEYSMLDKVINYILNTKIRYILFLFGVWLFATNNSYTGLWKIMSYIPINGAGLYRMIGAFIVFIFIPESNILKKILSCSFFVKLGGISSFTYAFHWPVILSFGCFIYYRAYFALSSSLLIVFVFLAVIAATLTLAYFYSVICRMCKNRYKKLGGILCEIINNSTSVQC